MVALGGVICHLLLIPPWVFCTVLPCVATAMLLQRAQLAVLVAQLVLSTLAYQKPKTGVPVALVSSAISFTCRPAGPKLGARKLGVVPSLGRLAQVEVAQQRPER